MLCDIPGQFWYVKTLDLWRNRLSFIPVPVAQRCLFMGVFCCILVMGLFCCILVMGLFCGFMHAANFALGRKSKNPVADYSHDDDHR